MGVRGRVVPRVVGRMNSRLVRMQKRGMLLSSFITGLCKMRAQRMGRTLGGGPSGFPPACDCGLDAGRLASLQSGELVAGVSPGSHSLPAIFARGKLCVLTAVLGDGGTATTAFTVVRAFTTMHRLGERLIGLRERASLGIRRSGVGHFNRILSSVIVPSLRATRARSALRLGFVVKGVGRAMGQIGADGGRSRS